MDFLLHLLFAYLQNVKTWFGICQKNYRNVFKIVEVKNVQCSVNILVKALIRAVRLFVSLFINSLLLLAQLFQWTSI